MPTDFGVACDRIAARRTNWTGRRDFIGACNHLYSVVSADQSSSPSEGDKDMVTFGGDCHKQSHTVVAVDENGRSLGERRIAATAAGHMEVLAWARQWPERRWALENCRQLSRLLEQDLLTAGEAVVQVSPKLMGRSRRAGRELGKSDPIDAVAVARAALQEPHLPVARLEGR